MLKQVLISTAYSAFRLYVGKNPFDRIVGIVKELMDDTSKTGAEKREFVIESTKAEFKTLSGAIIRAVIEIFLIAKTETYTATETK
jgi:hypothetical protein